MERHQQIKKKQASLRVKLEQKDIKVEDFVSQMRSLNEELKIVEQKMYDEHDNCFYYSCILSLDRKINLLQKENLLLENKIGLLNISKEKSKKHHLKIIKKDKYIHKLKESIKNDYLNFNEEMLPKSYLRISKRFPHLNLQEIIDFEKLVIDNGGNIQVHRGTFKLVNMVCRNANGSTHSRNISNISLMWDCCPVRINTINCCRFYNPNHRWTGETCSVGNGTNKKPYPDNSRSKSGITFYLNEEDEKLQDVKEVKVSNISSSILTNIKILEKTIEEYSNKILKLKGLQETLDLLLNDT